jgi:DNA-binding HxlR family transcriptional regulator
MTMPRALCAKKSEAALRCLEGRWKIILLSHLFEKSSMRFSALERAIPDVSHKVLTQQLRELERDGLVSRTVHPEVPPRVEYALTEIGRGLCPAFELLLQWAALREDHLARASHAPEGA